MTSGSESASKPLGVLLELRPDFPRLLAIGSFPLTIILNNLSFSLCSKSTVLKSYCTSYIIPGSVIFISNGHFTSKTFEY